MTDLFTDYLDEKPELMPFFGASPRDLLIREPEPGPWDRGLVEAINAYQAELGGATAIAGTEAAIVTGQQPGLFTGPLYTIYKGITAVVLAQRLASRFGVACVPMFWLGSDDHDFDEARTAHFLTKNHETLSLRYDPSTPIEGLPMYRMPVEDSLHGLIDRAAEQTPGSEHRVEVAQFLHESLDAAQSLADWTARILARLFHGTGLVVFSPHLQAARNAGRGVFEREMEEPLATTRLLNETGARLQELGYAQQVTKADNECCFFLEVDGRRRKLLFRDGRFELPEEGRTVSRGDMRGLLERAPEYFSSNVALRPILQQSLFPATTAYVAGPGEIAYWAQLKGVFDHFGAAMPIVYPRARCTLTSVKLRKLLEKTGLSLDGMTGSPRELLDLALRSTATSPAHDILEARRDALLAQMAELRANLARYDSNAAEMAASLSERTAAALDRIGRSLRHSDAARVATVEKQVGRLCTALAPWRRPQERVYTVCSFLFEQGWGLMDRLLNELNVESFDMNEVEF